MSNRTLSSCHPKACCIHQEVDVYIYHSSFRMSTYSYGMATAVIFGNTDIKLYDLDIGSKILLLYSKNIWTNVSPADQSTKVKDISFHVRKCEIPSVIPIFQRGFALQPQPP